MVRRQLALGSAALAKVTTATLVLALALGSCSGGAKKLSKADFIAKADAVCTDFGNRAKNITVPNNSSDSKALATYYRQAIDLAKKQTDSIDKLGRPKDKVDASKVDDLLNRERTALNVYGTVADALAKGDQPKATKITQSANAETKKINADLKAFGLTVCGQR